MPLVLGGGPKCKKCLKTVYKAEEKLSEAGIFHKLCFRCSACNKGLDSFTLTIHNENLFCKSCYGKNFGPSGYGFGGGGAGLMASEKSGPYVPKSAPQQTAPIAQAENGHIQSANPVAPAKTVQSFPENFKAGNDRCPRCNDRVYYAEKVVANGINWHKRCMRCATCGKSLDSTTVTEHGKEIYCKSCYGRQFGPKGFGFGLGAGTLSMQQ